MARRMRGNVLLTRLRRRWRRLRRLVRRRPVVAAVVALAVLALVGGGIAYAVHEWRSRAAPVAADPTIAPSAGCQEWTDGCRVCVAQEGTGAGGASCSNVGIACQPKALICTRAAPLAPSSAPAQ